MKKRIWASVVVLAVMTVAFAAAAVWLLRPADSTDSAGSPSTGGSESHQVNSSAAPHETAAVQARPDCPGPGLGGVDLPCLGGADSGQGTTGVAVVNVWAWWCEPCREELPALDEFAREHPEYTVVGVHADTNAANGAALLNDLGVGMPSYQDSENAFAGELGLPAVVPVTVVFRGEEKVGVLGRSFSSSSEIAQAVEEVL